MGGALHDYLASLVGKPDNTNGGVYSNSSAGYWATGEWHLYRYYNKQQTGVRVQSERSPNGYFDAFATWDSTNRKGAVIAGTNGVAGTFNLQLKGIESLSKKGVRMLRVVVKAVSFRRYQSNLSHPNSE
jgi:hypothetical protein